MSFHLFLMLRSLPSLNIFLHRVSQTGPQMVLFERIVRKKTPNCMSLVHGCACGGKCRFILSSDVSILETGVAPYGIEFNFCLDRVRRQSGRLIFFPALRCLAHGAIAIPKVLFRSPSRFQSFQDPRTTHAEMTRHFEYWIRRS